MVVPSWAVTTTCILLGPTANGMLPDEAPGGTTVPSTVTVATALVVVGFTVIEVVLLLSDTV